MSQRPDLGVASRRTEHAAELLTRQLEELVVAGAGHTGLAAAAGKLENAILGGLEAVAREVEAAGAAAAGRRAKRAAARS